MDPQRLQRLRRRRSYRAACLIVVVPGLLLGYGGASRNSHTWKIAPRTQVDLVGVDLDLTLRLRCIQVQPETVTELSLLGIAVRSGAGRRAADLVRELAIDAPLILSFDQHVQRDPQGRLTGYLYLADGRLLNELLLEAGVAQARHQVNHSLSHWFARVERRAAVNRSDPQPADEQGKTP